MPAITSFRDLIVWQKSMQLAVRVHRIAGEFPRQEQPVLGYQLRKSAVSIPSNIAEGFCRRSTAFYIQHLKTAAGSNAELETQLELGRRISLIPDEEAIDLTSSTQEIGRMLTALITSLERTR